MATRRSRNRQAIRNRRRGFPSWGGTLLGAMIGMIAVAVLMRHSLLPISRRHPAAQPTIKIPSPQDAATAKAGQSTATPKYDFYSVLSEKEVRIPDTKLSTPTKTTQQIHPSQVHLRHPSVDKHHPIKRVLKAVHQDITAAPLDQMPPQEASSNGYLLQVGAFRKLDAAEAIKAKLALQGFVANIRNIQLGGQTYHRVRLGPYASVTVLESVKRRLETVGIKTIALKEGR